MMHGAAAPQVGNQLKSLEGVGALVSLESLNLQARHGPRLGIELFEQHRASELRMWAGLGADVDGSWRRCGRVLAQPVVKRCHKRLF